MQKIYTGKQRDDLYRLAQQHDHLSPEDRIERAARSFEQEFRRLYPPTGHTIYVFAGAGRSGAYALGIARYHARLYERTLPRKTFGWRRFTPTSLHPVSKQQMC